MKKIMLYSIAIVILGIVIFTGIISAKEHMKDNINLLDKKDGRYICISIEKGENYLHKLKINSFITIKAPPQFAIWLEDMNGNYIQTLYATSKIINNNWSKAPSDTTPKNKIKRPEALPYWTHKKGAHVIIADEVSCATPKGNSVIKTSIKSKEHKYRVLAEFNNSTDFNAFYPKNAKPKDTNYSGGAWGSGQPAIVYEGIINLDLKNKKTKLKPIGHSSSDGKDGKLYKDLSTITTAKSIVKNIIVVVHGKKIN